MRELDFSKNEQNRSKTAQSICLDRCTQFFSVKFLLPFLIFCLSLSSVNANSNGARFFIKLSKIVPKYPQIPVCLFAQSFSQEQIIFLFLVRSRGKKDRVQFSRKSFINTKIRGKCQK